MVISDGVPFDLLEDLFIKIQAAPHQQITPNPPQWMNFWVCARCYRGEAVPGVNVYLSNVIIRVEGKQTPTATTTRPSEKSAFYPSIRKVQKWTSHLRFWAIRILTLHPCITFHSCQSIQTIQVRPFYISPKAKLDKELSLEFLFFNLIIQKALSGF